MSFKPLTGKICLVTGATRGIGKGIAVSLGAAGAMVYITGRTMNSNDEKNPGSLRSTAAEIEERGGQCVALQCDHSKAEEVRAVFKQISAEHDGRIDVLVNNAYSGVRTIMDNIGKKFWETGIEQWDDINIVGLRNTYLATVLASEMMAKRKSGLIINISSYGGLRYTFNVPYGVGKAAVDRMAADCSVDLKDHNVTFICLWPGMVQTEHMKDFLSSDGVAEKMSSSSTGISDKQFKAMQKSVDTAESPEFVGLCIVKLIDDENRHSKTGKILLTADLADEYDIIDPLTGEKPPNVRRIHKLMAMAGWKRLASVTPAFLKLPLWMLHLGGNKF